MNIIFALVAGPLLGWFIASRSHAAAIYLASISMLFTFQTLTVLLAWMADAGGFFGLQEEGAFGPTPEGFPVEYTEYGLWSYGAVNLVITLVGLAIVLGVNRLRARRTAQRGSVAVD